MDGSLLDQLGGESLHLAFLAIVGGVSTAAAVIGWLIRRDTRRTDAERAEDRLKLTAFDEKLADHIRRSGLEIKDVQYRIGILVAEIRPSCPQVTIPEWPSR